MQNKGQSSLEFLMIFGIGFLMVIIMGSLFFSYSNGARDSLDKSQLENIGNGLISNVEQLYFLGSGNRLTFKANFPDGIENFTIVHMNNSNVTNDIYFDYLNISYLYNGNIISSIFTASENYIRINCTRCYHFPLINGTGVSYYNDTSDFSQGPKVIRLYSEGDYVNIDFVKG